MGRSPYIEIAFTRIRKPFSESVYRSYLEKLPSAIQETNAQFIRWQDRHTHLMGKILLLSSSIRLGAGGDVLRDLKYNPFGKPLVEYLRFNISHSGEFVVCACTTSNILLGVDVEQKKPVNFGDFLNTMSPAQWDFINESPPMALDRFYSYWVVKESVIKAEGGGLSVPLAEICLSGNIASVGGRAGQWYVSEFSIHPAYAMAIAASAEVPRENIIIYEFQPVAR